MNEKQSVASKARTKTNKTKQLNKRNRSRDESKWGTERACRNAQKGATSRALEATTAAQQNDSSKQTKSIKPTPASQASVLNTGSPRAWLYLQKNKW